MEIAIAITMVYLIAGYFAVRFIHKNFEALPNVTIGIAGIIFWPFVVLFFLCMVNKTNWTDRIFGKSNKS